MKDKMKKVALIAAIFIQVALLFAFVPSFSWKLGNDCGIGGEFKPAGIYSISKVNADGTRTTRIYSRPINYRDEESNQWQPINAAIVDPTYNSETGLDGYITYDGSAYSVDTTAAILMFATIKQVPTHTDIGDMSASTPVVLPIPIP